MESPLSTADQQAKARALALYQEGGRLQVGRRFEEALALFEASFALSPCYKTATQASMCLAQLERHEEAIRWLQSARSLKPGDVWLLIHIAERYVDLGQPQAAEEYLGQALVLQPDHDMALDMLRELRGEPRPQPDPAAIARAEQALAVHHRGWGLMREQKSEALVHFQQSYAMHPTVGAACQASKCLDQLGRPDEALDWLLKAIALNPRQADVAMTIAREYLRRGQPAEALRYADQALAANPHHGPALRMRKALQDSADRSV